MGDETNNKLQQLDAKLDNHINECNQHRLDYQAREAKMLTAQETNTMHIAKLTESTQGLVDVWNAANTLQKFIKWLSGFTGIAGIAAMIAWWHELVNFFTGK